MQVGQPLVDNLSSFTVFLRKERFFPFSRAVLPRQEMTASFPYYGFAFAGKVEKR